MICATTVTVFIYVDQFHVGPHVTRRFLAATHQGNSGSSGRGVGVGAYSSDSVSTKGR